MKKTFIALLVLSLLLALLAACSAEAAQPDEPEPAPQADQIEPAKPELPAEPAPEPIAEPEPEPQPEPIAAVEPEPEPAPENTLMFMDCNETVYAISTVNLRSGPSTDYDKVGALSKGNSVTRTGTGTGAFENWSRVILADGTEVYVSSKYVSTTKPAAQQTTTTTSSGSKTSGGGTTQSSTPSGGTQSSGTSDTIYTWTPEGGGLKSLVGASSAANEMVEGDYSGTIH